MQRQEEYAAACCEEVLGQEFRMVASELRTYDLADMIAFSRISKSATIMALFDSASELYFVQDTFKLLDASVYRVEWGREPELKFSVMFQGHEVSVFFNVNLAAQAAWVEIEFVQCRILEIGSHEFPSFLRNALREKKRVPVGAGR